MLFWPQVSVKSSRFRHAVTPGESEVALFHKWCDKRVSPTEKNERTLAGQWTVNGQSMFSRSSPVTVG